MKHVKNERGYALLVVVLISVLVMGFFTFFVTASLNNANQEQVVDENHLKVAAAEMGVEYYVATLTNVYNSLLERGNNPEQLYIDFRNIVSQEYSEIKKENIAESYYYKGQINPDENIIPNEDNIEVTGNVKGGTLSSDSLEGIDFTLSFPLPPEASSNKSDEVNKEKEGLRLISIPGEPCTTNHDEKDILNGNCYVDRNAPIDHLPSDVEGNSYKMHNNKSLYVKGKLEMPRRNNGNPPDIKDSFIYVEGEFKVANGFVPKGNTRIFIDGDFYVGPGNMPKPGKDTQICVTGKIMRNSNDKEINNQMMDEGEGIIYTRNKAYEEKNGAKYVSSDEELKEACGIIANSNLPDDEIPEINWINPETQVDYN